MSLFERTEKEMIENAPIELFKTGGRQVWACRLRPAATIDAWLTQADEMTDQAETIDRLSLRVGEKKAEYDSAIGKPEEQAAYDTYVEARNNWRSALRRWIDSMLQCVCDYAPESLDHAEITRQGVTDAQIIIAYNKLRYFSNPLAAQQIVIGDLLKAAR